jgi:hypothetical protein
MVNKYVLKTDERMPSRRNLWGIVAATSLEEATGLFQKKIGEWHAPSTLHHPRCMEEDRDRRLGENDFAVELL